MLEKSNLFNYFLFSPNQRLNWSLNKTKSSATLTISSDFRFSLEKKYPIKVPNTMVQGRPKQLCRLRQRAIGLILYILCLYYTIGNTSCQQETQQFTSLVINVRYQRLKNKNCTLKTIFYIHINSIPNYNACFIRHGLPFQNR